MPITTLSLGVPGTFSKPLYPDKKNFELVTHSNGNALVPNMRPVELDPSGNKWGTGGLGKYPNKVQDGLFVSKGSVLTADELAALDLSGFELYSFAADSNTKPVKMIFTNNSELIIDLDNRPTTYNTATDPHDPTFTGTAPNVVPTYDADFVPGRMGTHVVSVIDGQFVAWVSQDHFNEDISGLAEDDYVSVSEGKLIKYVAGTAKAVGQVEAANVHTNGNIKLRIQFNLNIGFGV